jgi:hypothetical protein
MMRRLSTLSMIVALVGCAPRDPQNSAACGIMFMASGNRVLDQLVNFNAVLKSAPDEIKSGYVPTRVLGYRASRSVASVDGEMVVLQFEGDGLPDVPGFGLALVDDSSEVFRGVLVFEPDPPRYDPIGSVTGAGKSVPLFGLRVQWSSVNSDRCPLFPDTSGVAASSP